MSFLSSGEDRVHAALVAFLAITYIAFVGSGALPSEQAPSRRAPARVLADRAGFALILGVLPLLACRLLGQAPPGSSFLSLGAIESWAAPALALSVLAATIAFFAPKSKADLAIYPQYLPARWTPDHLALEIASWAIYLFAYEAVFRGFLLAILLPAGTLTAIAAQTALYAFAHFPKSQKETRGSLVFGVIASLMTLGWGTIWPAFLVHLALALGNDLACARAVRATVPRS